MSLLHPISERLRRALPLLAVLVLAGCSDTPQSERTGTERTETQQSEIRLIDVIGEEIVLPRPATRVVSLAPNMTEIIAAIGGEKSLVGRSSFCDYPPSVLSVPAVGDLHTLNFEKLLQQKPDLVLMSWVGNIGANYKKLKDIGLRPYALGAYTISGAINAIDTIGILMGRVEEAKRISGALRSEVDSILRLAAAGPRVSVFVVIDKSPLMTVSRDFLHDMLVAAGGDNIAAGGVTAYPFYNREELLRRNPDVIIIPATGTEAIDEILALYPEWREMKAVRNGHIYAIPRDIVFRPGPRLGRGLRAIYEALHGADAPELFRRYNTP